MVGERWLVFTVAAVLWPAFWLFVLLGLPVRIYRWSDRALRAWIADLNLSPVRLAFTEIVLVGVSVAAVYPLSAWRAFSWLEPLRVVLAAGLWAIVLASFIRLRFGSRRDLFYEGPDPRSADHSRQVDEMVDELRNSENPEESFVQTAFSENPRVVGDALGAILSGPKEDQTRERTLRFVCSVEHDRSKPRSISPFIAYMNEKLEKTQTCSWVLDEAGRAADAWKPGGWTRFGLRIKRLIDIVLSVAALCSLSFPLAVIAFALKAYSDNNAPAVFTTTRLGKNGQSFSYQRLNAISVVPSDGTRYLTGLHRVVIWLGLDRLLTLINVLGGEMSLVGPRPLYCSEMDRLVEEVVDQKKKRGELVTQDEARTMVARRLLVKPGFTGVAEVRSIIYPRGANCAEYLEMDLAYIDSWSPFRDIVILVESVLLWIWHALTVVFIVVWPGLAAYLTSPQNLFGNLGGAWRVLRGRDPLGELWVLATRPMVGSAVKVAVGAETPGRGR